MTENQRIASLTTDAVRTSADRMVADIKAVVEQSDEMAEAIRQIATKFENDIGARTLEITDVIGSYVAFCGKTADLFKGLQTSASIPNGNGHPDRGHWEDEISKIRSMLPSQVDGR